MDKSSWSNNSPNFDDRIYTEDAAAPRKWDQCLEVGRAEEISSAPIVKIWVREL